MVDLSESAGKRRGCNDNQLINIMDLSESGGGDVEKINNNGR